MKSQYIFIRHTKIHKYQQFKDFSKLCTFKIYMINNISITNQVSSAHSFNSCVVRSLVVLFLIFKLYLIIYLTPLLTMIQLYHGCQSYWLSIQRKLLIWCHWQTLSYKSVSSIHLPWGAIKHKTLVVIGVDCIGEDTNPTTILSQPWWPIIKWSNVNHILPFTVIWVKLEDIFDSERCQLSDCVTVVYSLLHTMKERKKKNK